MASIPFENQFTSQIGGISKIALGNSDDDWLRRIEYVGKQAENWYSVVIPGFDSPANGSSLAADSVIPHLDVYAHALLLISSAAEHLTFATAEGFPISKDKESGAEIRVIPVYPAAQHTVARSAVMTASLAIWMLNPSARAERQYHCLQFLWEDARLRMNALVAMKPYIESNDFPITESSYNTNVATLQQQQNSLKDIAKEQNFPMDKNGSPLPFKQTDVVAYACTQIQSSKGQPYDLLLWRMSSAAAHGMPFHALRNAVRIGDSSDGIRGVYSIEGSLQEVGPVLVGAYMLTHHALVLVQKRSVNHLDSLKGTIG